MKKSQIISKNNIVACSLILSVATFLTISCSDTCKSESMIPISDPLKIEYRKKMDKHYCSVIDQSLKGDSASICLLSYLNIGDAIGYDHGYVLVRIIKKIGEKKYLHAIRSADKNRKKMIKGYIIVGLEYGENSFNGIETVFPEIANFLNN